MKPLRMGISIAGAFVLLLSLPAQVQTPPEAPPPGIRVAADGVFVRVLVTDRLNRYIAGLGQDNFRIYENGALQRIQYFTQQSAPINIGIILDLRGSLLKNELETASTTIYRWLSSGNREDEFFLIWFDQKTAQLRTFSSKTLAPQDVPLGPAAERTAFSITASEGLDLIRKGKAERKALILMAEGDATGQAFGSQVGNLMGQSEVQLFGIARRVRLGNVPSLLPGMTGIRDFLVPSSSEIVYYLNLIRDELRNQYVLGYAPPGNRNDGKWRKVEVKLNEPPGLPDLKMRVSKGYYASLK